MKVLISKLFVAALVVAVAVPSAFAFEQAVRSEDDVRLHVASPVADASADAEVDVGAEVDVAPDVVTDVTSADPAPDASDLASDRPERDLEKLRLGCEVHRAPAVDAASDRPDTDAARDRRLGIACKWSQSEHRGFAGYILWRSDGHNRTKPCTTRERSHTRCFDTDVRPGGTYIYRVHVMNAHGRVIGQSNVTKVHIPGDRFEELRLACEAVVRGDQRAIACKWSESEHRAFAGYRVWKTDGDHRSIVFASRERGDTHLFDTQVRRGQRYIYKVEVLNADGRVIGASNTASAGFPRPDAKTDVRPADPKPSDEPTDSA